MSTIPRRGRAQKEREIKRKRGVRTTLTFSSYSL